MSQLVDRPGERRGPIRRCDRARRSVPARRQRALAGAVASPGGRWCAVVLAAFVTHTTSVLIVVVALVIMIMLHELGHFLTAKWGRMKVTEYFLGFGPRLWSIRRGETEYGIKAIPAGGYVKIIGMTSAEEVDPADEARTYRQRPFHNRLLVAVAGSAMHGVMAFVLLWGLFVFIGAPRATPWPISGFSPLAHGVDPARAAGLAGRRRDRRASTAAPVHSATDLQTGDRASRRDARHPGGRARRPATGPSSVTPQRRRDGVGATGRIGVVIGSPPVIAADRSTPVGQGGAALRAAW